MYAVGNAAASVPGMVLPPLGLLLMKWSGGSWLPLFALCGAITMATGGAYHHSASVTPGRELLQLAAEEKKRPPGRADA